MNVFPLNGVGLVKLGWDGGMNCEEFYAVFIGGRVLPMKFKSWKEACEHYRWQMEGEAA
ncbi:hypothetical protein [Bradyrhizobium neotropicale]|uniref:hypothetical protein n=1 Tax=Bradyrhizobium neotropicale TaxID=1497615 RepID=UPI001AD6DC44|nr:hypothetical protein [Bradyrhizobium neotropicale]MBO4228049.1 hypothetical protein [Bradyrhizobium neotropicale]